MLTELPRENTGARRDRSLFVAYWVIGIIAAAELIVAAVGLAPKVASNVRKSQTVNVPAEQRPSSAVPQASSQPSGVQQPAPVTNQTAAIYAPLPAGTPDQPTPELSPAPGPETTDRPFRKPSSDTASTDGAAIEILHAEIKGNDGGSKTLQLAIKSRSRETIDVPQVKVQVYFYDEQNGEIVPSKAQVTSRWLSAPVDWKNGKPELLEVRYLSDTVDPDIRFAGFVVAVYYKGDLQDCRAEPAKLKKLFEPKYFIGIDDP